MPDNAAIRVIGLGGAGNNAINHMIEAGLEDVDFIAVNTDAQALAGSLARTRVQLGERLTKGLGAGAKPEVGEKAALQERQRFGDLCVGADLVFITAGMGGGTGTGSAAVVAGAAREVGALVVAVVTTPFAFEGPKRMLAAEEGLRRLQGHVDALIVVENQRLHAALGRNISLRNAFRIADRVLYHGVRGIHDIINQPGMINVDFADVRTLLSDAGIVLMGIGAGRGEKLVEDAVASATHSPLLARDLSGAQQLLINITGSEDLTLFDAYDIVERISEATGVDGVNVLFGVTYDQMAADEVRLTVIAAGSDKKTTDLRPADLLAGMPHTSSSNYDIPAFLRYNPDT